MKFSDGFAAADSRNLPKVDFFMYLDFVQESECYNAAESRSAKALLASRDAYVETAVGYVEIKRESNICTVKCRVTPEHKLKGKLYLVIAKVDESLEKILSVECNDCAASAGGCKHTICCIMWLIKRTDEPPSTSIECYWIRPKLAGVLGNEKFVLAKNIKPSKRKTTQNKITMNVSLDMFIQESKKRKIESGMILNYCGDIKPSLKDFSVYNIMLKFIKSSNDHSYKKFIDYSTTILTQSVISNIAESTKQQADSKLWHLMRRGRVTASKIHEAVHCKTDNGALVQSILGGYKVPETEAIKRGKLLEKEVVTELEKHFSSVIKPTGLILINPIIGASPDGLCKDFVIEIKCPISMKTMKNYIKDNHLQEKCKAQIMIQMHAANKDKGLFAVADPTFESTKLIHMYWVDYDKIYAETLLTNAEIFWKSCIFDKLLTSTK